MKLETKKRGAKPETVPYSRLSDLSKKYLFWKQTAMLIMMLMLGILMLKTFLDSPSYSGYATFDSEADSTTRFSATTSVLLVIFMLFGLVLFMFSKKMDQIEKDG